MKKYILICLIIGLICVACLWALREIGIRSTGTVRDVTRVPVVGRFFSPFKVDGDVHYVAFVSGKSFSCLFSGKTTEEDIVRFCRLREINFSAREPEHSQIPMAARDMEADPNKIMSQFGDTDFYAAGVWTNDQGRIQIRFRARDGAFTAYVEGPK